jgi:Common central domain of tyrosinase
VDAVLALKRARSPYNSSLSYYDQFVQWHKDRYLCNSAADGDDSTMQMVHAAPMFLPWHRELLRRFEDALREVVGDGGTMPTAGALIEMTTECGGTTPRNGQQYFDVLPAEPLAISFDEGSSCAAYEIGHLEGRPAHLLLLR